MSGFVAFHGWPSAGVAPPTRAIRIPAVARTASGVIVRRVPRSVFVQRVRAAGSRRTGAVPAPRRLLSIRTTGRGAALARSPDHRQRSTAGAPPSGGGGAISTRPAQSAGPGLPVTTAKLPSPVAPSPVAPSPVAPSPVAPSPVAPVTHAVTGTVGQAAKQAGTALSSTGSTAGGLVSGVGQTVGGILGSLGHLGAPGRLRR